MPFGGALLKLPLDVLIQSEVKVGEQFDTVLADEIAHCLP